MSANLVDQLREWREVGGNIYLSMCDMSDAMRSDWFNDDTRKRLDALLTQAPPTAPELVEDIRAIAIELEELTSLGAPVVFASMALTLRDAVKLLEKGGSDSEANI